MSEHGSVTLSPTHRFYTSLHDFITPNNFNSHIYIININVFNTIRFVYNSIKDINIFITDYHNIITTIDSNTITNTINIPDIQLLTIHTNRFIIYNTIDIQLLMNSDITVLVNIIILLVLLIYIMRLTVDYILSNFNY